MEKLGLALKVIQNGMRQNTQITIKTSLNMFIGHNGEASGEKDSLTTTEPHGWREQCLGALVQLSESQVHIGHHPGSSGNRY